MEIHLSVGVATLVALMAADRADPGTDRTTPRVFDLEAFAQFGADLDPGGPQAVESDPALR
jgi:hypothetical protein